MFISPVARVNVKKEISMSKLRQRLAREEGFTLIELLVVIVIIGILLAIAVPSYLGFKDRANQRAASADVRSAIPSAEAFYADNGCYNKASAGGATCGGAAMALGDLQGYDQGLKLATVRVSTDGKTYCLDKTVGGKASYVIRGFAPHTPTNGGSGDVDETGTCPATVSNTAN